MLLGHLEANTIHHAAYLKQRSHAVAALRARSDAQEWLAQGAALGRDQLVAYALSQLADAER